MHDIGRSKSHDIDHGLVGAKIAESEALPDSVVEIIKRHVGGGITAEEAKQFGWPKDVYWPLTLEEKIVSYADKRIDKLRRVPIELEIERLKLEHNDAAERVRKLHRRNNQFTWRLNMTTVLTLLVKASNAGLLKHIDDLLKAEFENLDLDVKVLGSPVNKWVQVSLSGEDEAIATSYINKEIGTCPISIKKVEKNSVLKGYISKVDGVKQELKVDVGIFEPKIVQATIPLAYLQAQLAGGKNFDLKKISDAYGLHREFTVEHQDN